MLAKIPLFEGFRGKPGMTDDGMSGIAADSPVGLPYYDFHNHLTVACLLKI
jgi:hypothetical protein